MLGLEGLLSGASGAPIRKPGRDAKREPPQGVRHCPKHDGYRECWFSLPAGPGQDRHVLIHGSGIQPDAIDQDYSEVSFPRCCNLVDLLLAGCPLVSGRFKGALPWVGTLVATLLNQLGMERP